jgi:hypothetical protein
MLSDMTEFGEFYKSQGGTFAQGTQAAAQMSTASGLAPDVTLQLQKSGFVQARQMQQSGLMPWQLAQMSPQERLMSSLDTVQMMGKQLGPGSPDRITKDQFGFQQVISGSQKQDATIGMMLGGIPAEQVAMMRRNANKIKRGTAIQQGFSNYQQSAERIAGSGLSESQKMSQLSSLSEGPGFKKMLGAMKSAGFGQSDIDAVAGSNGGGTGSSADLLKRIQGRYGTFEKQLGKLSGSNQYQNQGPQVLVGLSPEAMKMLKIKNNMV